MPWFIWKIEKVFFILSAVLIAMSMLISRNLSCPILNEQISDTYPVVSSSQHNDMYSKRRKCKCLYSPRFLYDNISIALHGQHRRAKTTYKISVHGYGNAALGINILLVLYILGFPLPSSPIAHETLMYSYTNYYFFLIDDRSFLILLPRFQSVFMEPGHLGTASVLLLLTQLGKWKKWYNVILLIATLMSFSLAAFVLLAIVLFINVWLKRKRILPKILLVVGILTSTAIVAIFYNDGDNMLNTLIIDVWKLMMANLPETIASQIRLRQNLMTT